MASPLAYYGQENARPQGSRQHVFQHICDDNSEDESEVRNLHFLQETTRDLSQSEDVISCCLEDAKRERDTMNAGDGHDAGATCAQEEELHSELFVSSDEGKQEDMSPQQDDVKIKVEPGLEKGSIFIDASQASSDAQAWIKPFDGVIDLTGEDEDSHGGSSQSSAIKEKARDIEKRKVELAMKLVNGTLSAEGMSELSRLTSQRHCENDDTRAGITENESNAADSAEVKITKTRKKRQPAAKNAAEHFSRLQAQEALKQQSKRSAADEGSSRPSKKTKLSAKERRRMEEGARRLQSMRQLQDAIQERAEKGDLPDEPRIDAQKTRDQLKQMSMNISEHADKDIIGDQKRELRQATSAWGRDGVRAMNGKWLVRGLQSVLPNHQLVVGAWMLGRELKQTRDLPLGGILADTMGMGKTIETLSCMTGNQAPDSLREEGKGATLVVCQSGQMIDQWMAEIEKHCDKTFSKRILHYKVGNKMKLDVLTSFNVVFTSYCQLRESIPSAKERARMMGVISDPVKYQAWLDQRTGDLFRIGWYRVVLDEAHMIKNYQSHTAFSCGQLEATNRWAVTGTPLINSSQEFFSYLKFIRFNIGDIGDYRREYCKGPEAKERQKKLAFEIMYRRTHGDEFLGQRILNLPTTHPTHQYLMLSKEETVIYRMMERCFRRKLNSELKDGVAEKQIMCYLTMLLRLRQAATHPFLLEGMIGEYFTLEDIATTKERLKLLKGGETVYEQIGSWDQRHKNSDERMLVVIAEAERRKADGITGSRLRDVLQDDQMNDDDDIVPAHSGSESTPQDDIILIDDDADEVNSVDEAEEDADGMAPVTHSHATGNQSSGNEAERASTRTETHRMKPFGKSSFGLHFHMDRQFEYLERLELLQISKCGICTRKPVDPVKGNRKCTHVFCLKCIIKHLANRGRQCPRCRMIVGEPKRIQPFNDDAETDEDSDSHSQSRQNRKKYKDKEYKLGFDYGGFQPEEDDKKDKKPIRFLQLSDRQPDVPVTPSAKIVALKETILKWQQDSPDDKIIIFSQFDAVMKVVGRMLQAEGIQFAYLSGKMTTDARSKAVKEFEQGDEVRVLVASLRAGGTALNLTRGNRVVLMELWWNHAIEQQAFGRVFRIGQTKETHFLRFVVKTPIEQRMLSMQADKMLAIDEALQDDGTRTPKLSVEDIANLLGKVVRDEDGVMQVHPDYSDGEDYDDDDDDLAAPHAATNAATAENDEYLQDFVVGDEEIEYEDDEEYDDED